MSLPTYTVWFRGFPACPCLAEWLPVFEQELKRRGIVSESIDIAQLIGDAAASGNTHALGGAFDIWQHDDTTVWVARQMGAPATWARTTGSFANNRHTHGVLSGCDHNGPARYQITEVWAGGDGLVGSTPDPGPRPLVDRTWREGIAWARQQGEFTMDTEAKAAFEAAANDRKRIEAKIDRALEKSKRIATRLTRANDLLREAAKTDRNIADAVEEIGQALEEANN